jgi:hypothetical protein
VKGTVTELKCPEFLGARKFPNLFVMLSEIIVIKSSSSLEFKRFVFRLLLSLLVLLQICHDM